LNQEVDGEIEEFKGLVKEIKDRNMVRKVEMVKIK